MAKSKMITPLTYNGGNQQLAKIGLAVMQGTLNFKSY